jgi:cold shock protein
MTKAPGNGAFIRARTRPGHDRWQAGHIRDYVLEETAVPTGKVKWFNGEKGFGFLADDDGGEVFVHRDALPDGVTELKPGARVEFGVVQGRKGSQALSVRLLDPVPSVARATRKPADEMTPIVEDLIKLLDGVSNGLRRGRYPERSDGRKVASVLRAVADNLDA